MKSPVYVFTSILLLLTAASIIRWIGSWPLIISTLSIILALCFLFLAIKPIKITHFTDFSLSMVIYAYLFTAVGLPLLIFLFTHVQLDIWSVFLTEIIGLFCVGVVILVSLIVTLISIFGKEVNAENELINNLVRKEKELIKKENETTESPKMKKSSSKPIKKSSASKKQSAKPKKPKTSKKSRLSPKKKAQETPVKPYRILK